MNSESTLSDALSEIDAAIAAADYERASSLTDELRDNHGDAVGLWRVRSRAFESAGKFAAAAEAYARVLDFLPADADAMAGNARALLALGRADEAKAVARQALDHTPSDPSLARMAGDDGEPYVPDATSALFRDANEQLKAGLPERALARLRHVAAQWPLRADAQIMLAHALWRSGACAGAAEVCQTVLDTQPDCLDAHVLLLALWRRIGPPGLDQLHLQAINRIDPDHRCTKAILGADSPVEIQDVPAMRTEIAPLTQDDELSRADWVDNLVAAAMSAPKPLERPSAVLDFAASTTPLEDDDTAIAEDALDGPNANAIAQPFAPLQWTETSADPDDQAAARDEIAAEWLPMDQPDANAFVPSRPSRVTPDATDGVPQSIEPLQWETPTSAVTTAVTATVIAATHAKRSPDEPAEINAPISSEVAATSLPNPVPNPKRPTALRANLAADARRALEEGRWQDATDLYRKAISSARGKRLDGIISDLEAVAKVQPSSKRVYELLGEAYARKGEWAASREAFNRALELVDEA